MELVRRNKVFQHKKTVSSLIKGLQESIFDKDFDTINDEKFDAILVEAKKVKNTEICLMLSHSDINLYPIVLTERLKELLNYLKTKKLILISHLKLDFYGNLEHEYEKVINAYSELSKITNTQTYKEAIEIKVEEIGKLTEGLFWLTRCDPSFPEYVFWTDMQERFCFYFCKYGNIHFIDFTEGSIIRKIELNSSDFIINEDYDQFSANGIIENRKLNINTFK